MDRRRRKYTEPFYATAAWRRVRALVLMRDGGMCCECMRRWRAGEHVRPRPATLVHHIVPYKDAPDKALETDNLESLCDTCHNRRHEALDAARHAGAGTQAGSGVRIIRI